MSQPFLFLGNIPPPGPDEEAETDRLIEKAKFDGNPWSEMAGVFKRDPLFEEWAEIMRENRRKADEDPNY